MTLPPYPHHTRGNPAMFKAAVVCALLLVAILAFATVARCEERPMRFALTTMAIGQSLDTLTTMHALHHGAVERNPLLGTQPSAAKLVAAKLPMIGVGWLLSKIAPKHPKLARGTAYVIGWIGAGLALHNWRQGR